MAAIVTLGLPERCSTVEAEAALAAWARIAEAAPAWRQDERRIGQMTAEIEAFGRAVQAVLAQLSASP